MQHSPYSIAVEVLEKTDPKELEDLGITQEDLAVLRDVFGLAGQMLKNKL